VLALATAMRVVDSVEDALPMRSHDQGRRGTA